MMNMEDLKEFMKTVDRIGTKHGLVQNDQYYSQIIQFVNTTFGIITNIDEDRVKNIQTLQANQTITLRNFIDGFQQPSQQIQSGDSRLSSLSKLVESEKEQRNSMYTNMRFIIEKSIDKMAVVLNEFKKDADDTNQKNSINKYIRNQYKLL